MADIRKLQYIGKQHLINIPAHLARWSGWQDGDFIQFIPKEPGLLAIRRVGEKGADRAAVILATYKQEATALRVYLDAASDKMNGGDYAAASARLSHVLAQIRKLKRRIGTRTAQAASATTTT